MFIGTLRLDDRGAVVAVFGDHLIHAPCMVRHHQQRVLAVLLEERVENLRGSVLENDRLQ